MSYHGGFNKFNYNQYPRHVGLTDMERDDFINQIRHDNVGYRGAEVIASFLKFICYNAGHNHSFFGRVIASFLKFICYNKLELGAVPIGVIASFLKFICYNDDSTTATNILVIASFLKFICYNKKIKFVQRI